MGRWQTSRFKTVDQSPTNIAMRQHHAENRAEALLRLYIKINSRECVRADVTCWLVERDDTAVTDRSCCSPNGRDGITLVVQDVAADRGIEFGAFGKSLVRRDHEFNLSISGCARSRLRYVDHAGFAIECNNAPNIADSLGEEHGHVAGAAADIEHAHSRPDATFPDQSSGDRLNDAGLKLKTFNFKFCMTQDVGGRDVHGPTIWIEFVAVLDQSPLMFAAFMMGHHFSISAR